VAISHHAVVANVIQMVSGAGVTFLDNDRPLPPGSVAFGVLPFFRKFSLFILSSLTQPRADIGGLIASLHYMPFCAVSLFRALHACNAYCASRRLFWLSRNSAWTPC
jgi:hypothetical protein